MDAILIALVLLGASRYADLKRLDELIFSLIWIAFAFLWIVLS